MRILTTHLAGLLVACLLAGLFANTLPPSVALAAEASQPSADARTILVKVSPGLLPNQLAITPLARRLGILTLPVPAGWTTADYAATIRNLSGVDWTEVDGTIGLAALKSVAVNDPLAGSQTALNQIRLPEAWAETEGSANVTVAIIDTGIDGQHQDLIGRVIAGYNFLTNAPIAAGASSDDNGHGTAVAGIIGAAGNNNLGIAGVDWQAKLMPLKVADASGVATADRVASAITYATDHGAKILNLSLGATGDFQTVHDAIIYAANHGVIVVAAAGNDGGSNDILYPAAYPEVISVGSVSNTDAHSSFSDAGPQLDLVAPGESIVSTGLSANHNTYASATGTSVAAPFVSGTAGLILSRFPGLSRSQVQSLLENQADKVVGMAGQTRTDAFGYGRLDAARVVSLHAAFVSQNAYPTLQPGQSYQFIVYVRNLGAMTWQQGAVNLGTDRQQDRIPTFTEADDVTHAASGWISDNRVESLETSVPTGEVASFVFWYTVPQTMASGTYREYFRPVADGLSWLEDMGIYWDITVKTLADSYSAGFVDQNSYPTLKPGQSYQLQVQLRNTGSVTWDQSTVHLGTDGPQDRIPQFVRDDLVGHNPSGWISPNRVKMEETSVPPGGIGTFYFWYTVPQNLAPGVYREYFSPVADGITWMKLGVYWDISIQSAQS